MSMGLVRRVKHLWVGALALIATTTASAAYVNCPGTPAVTTDREFGVQMTGGSFSAICDSFGSPNNPNTFAGFTYIDKDQTDDALPGSGFNENWFSITGLGTTSGGFTIASNLTGQFSEFLLVIKSGGGQWDPDYAVFSLSGGTSAVSWTGDWRIVQPQGINGDPSLSHMSLYGKGGVDVQCVENCASVPLPGTAALFGSALMGFAVVGRRRRLL